MVGRVNTSRVGGLKSHADGSAHTRRAYDRIGHRFVAALAAAGSDLRRGTIDDVQAAIEGMRLRPDGTVNTYVAAVKSLLGFAHTVGYSRFNAAPLSSFARRRASWRRS